MPVPTGDQRDPFVRGCVPADTDPHHDTDRVKTATTGLRQGAVSAWFHGWFEHLSSRGQDFGTFLPCG